MKSGLLSWSLAEAGNSATVDFGFAIADLLEMKGVVLNILPIRVNDKLSEKELITRQIAALCIHVEHANSRIKLWDT